VKATLHWVSAEHAVDADVRLYDRLFTVEDPDGVSAKTGKDFTVLLNPDSLEVVSGCKVEPALREAHVGARYQFERLGYFAVDPDSRPDRLIFNRTASLKDTWAKIASKQ
jgi:glutaminyl-tRNA synthetase